MGIKPAKFIIGILPHVAPVLSQYVISHELLAFKSELNDCLNHFVDKYIAERPLQQTGNTFSLK